MIAYREDPRRDDSIVVEAARLTYVEYRPPGHAYDPAGVVGAYVDVSDPGDGAFVAEADVDP